MKTKLTLLVLLCTASVWAQIPSINEKNISYAEIYAIKKVVPKSVNDTVNYLSKVQDSIARSLFKVNMLLNESEMNDYGENINGVDSTKTYLAKQYIETVRDSVVKELVKIGTQLEKSKSKVSENTPKTIAQHYEDYVQQHITRLHDSIARKKLEVGIPLEVSKVHHEIQLLETEIKQYQTDSKEFIDNKYRLKRFLPSWKKFYRESFSQKIYGNTSKETKFLNNLSYVNYNQFNTIQSELVSDFVKGIRISLGTVVAINTSDSIQNKTQKQTIEKLINGGGNFYIDFTLPIFTTYNEQIFTYYFFASARAATNLKNFDNDQDTTTANGMLGISNYLGFSSENKRFNFFLNTSSNWHFGAKDFYNDIGITNRKPFFNTNILFGITVERTYRVILRTNWSSEPTIRTEKIALGIQLTK